MVGHVGVLVMCFVFVLFWCGVLGLGFLSSVPLNTTNLASVHIFTYIHYLLHLFYLDKGRVS